MTTLLVLSLFCILYGTSHASTDGAIGCLHAPVCGSEDICVDDGLFGLCVPEQIKLFHAGSDFIVPTTPEQKSVLADGLRSLAESGYTWEDDETQCAMKWLVLSFNSETPSEPPECMSLLQNVKRDQQGQKRVSEKLADAFRSYAPQEGFSENEHLVEKYPKLTDSQLSGLSQYVAQDRSQRDSSDLASLIRSMGGIPQDTEIIVIPENSDNDFAGASSDDQFAFAPVDDDDDVYLPMAIDDNSDLIDLENENAIVPLATDSSDGLEWFDDGDDDDGNDVHIIDDGPDEDGDGMDFPLVFDDGTDDDNNDDVAFVFDDGEDNDDGMAFGLAGDGDDDADLLAVLPEDSEWAFDNDDVDLEESGAMVPYMAFDEPSDDIIVFETDEDEEDDSDEDMASPIEQLVAFTRENNESPNFVFREELEEQDKPSWLLRRPSFRTGGLFSFLNGQPLKSNIYDDDDDDKNNNVDIYFNNKYDSGEKDNDHYSKAASLLLMNMLGRDRDQPQLSSHHKNKDDDDKSTKVKFVETNYNYIATDPPVRSEPEAAAFLDCALRAIGKSSSESSIDLTSWNGEVVFKVGDLAGETTANNVAKLIEASKDKISEKCNRHVRAVGFGKNEHLALRQQEAAIAQKAEAEGPSNGRWSTSHTVIVTLVVILSIGVAGVIAFFVLVRVAVRRGHMKYAMGTVHDKIRDWKSKSRRQYEELCRETIASKAGCSSSLKDKAGAASRQVSTPPPSPPPWAEEPRPTDLDVSTAHVVLAYMEEHLKNRGRLEEEWNELCSYSPDRSDLSVAMLAENSSKNRDQNVVPYDHNRVKLCSEANAFKADYINASHIVDTDPRRPAYVVTQVPLAETVADFWQLVWEQKSTLIVYLAQPNEPKAVRYWPDEGLTLYHRWQIGLVSEHAWNDDFIVRSLVLKDTATGDSRTVTQFHFLAWPANGVPRVCRSILAFRRKANRSYRPHASPIVVQSTNGGGRAGTYTLLDMTLNHIAKGAREVDISANLEHLRDQRNGLVKTKEQFEFVLICVAEEIAAIVKSSREASGSSSPE